MVKYRIRTDYPCCLLQANTYGISYDILEIFEFFMNIYIIAFNSPPTEVNGYSIEF